MKILIIDDSEIVHKSVKDFMSGTDFHFSSAYNGKEALELFEKDHLKIFKESFSKPLVGPCDLICNGPKNHTSEVWSIHVSVDEF